MITPQVNFYIYCICFGGGAKANLAFRTSISHFPIYIYQVVIPLSPPKISNDQSLRAFVSWCYHPGYLFYRDTHGECGSISFLLLFPIKLHHADSLLLFMAAIRTYCIVWSFPINHVHLLFIPTVSLLYIVLPSSFITIHLSGIPCLY